MGEDMSEGGTAKTVSELFDREVSDRNENPLETLPPGDRREAFDGFERTGRGLDRDPDRSNQFEGDIALWTLSTVALALIAALLLGFVSIDTGATTTAFGAGMLTGGSGLVLGFALMRESQL